MEDHGIEGPGLSRQTARAAAQTLDLGWARRLVYVGGEGELLAALLDAWTALNGVWLGPADAQHPAEQFLGDVGLDDRVQYRASESLDAVAAADLVVLTAVDADADRSLRLLTSAGPQWLPADGRWLILVRNAPHPSGEVGPSQLHRQGLRVVTEWPLSQGVRMLVCARAHHFLEALGDRAAREAAWGQPS